MTDNARLKRIKMRSWRRGTKEMDLILGPFAESEAAGMTEAELDLYELLLAENDQDLYPWITARMNGIAAGPEQMGLLMNRIADFASKRLL